MSEQINIEFFDEYKRLDKLCAELFGKNSGGITSYINEMEAKSIMGNQTHRIAEWNGFGIFMIGLCRCQTRLRSIEKIGKQRECRGICKAI